MISSVTYLKTVSEASSGTVCPLQSWTCVLCCVFFAAQPSHAPSSAISTQMEELMQLDCSWASSGTTSNDITSICAACRQQCLCWRETANRHGSCLAEAEAMRPCWEARQRTGQSICQFPQQSAEPQPPPEGGSWTRQPMAPCAQDLGITLLTGHRHTLATKDQCREGKLKSDLSSDNCHLLRKYTLDAKRRA